MKYTTVGTESGSYGNLTISRGRAGQFKRSRVFPLNPRSPAQTTQRDIITSLAARWRGLTDPEMIAWDNFASAKGLTQKGFNAFSMVNALNIQSGVAVTLSPPPLAAFGIFTATGLTATVDGEANTLTLSIDGAANDIAPTKYIVEATKSVSSGRRNLGSEFRVINGGAMIANLGGATATLGQSYTAKLGLPLVGSRIQVRVSQFTDGQRTLGRVFDAIVAEA